MTWRLFWFAVALVGLTLQTTCHAQIARSASTHEPLICVIIRTYWKHGEGSPGPLERLIHSLRKQTHQRWEAQLVIMDSQPFMNATDILQSFSDDRLWIYANWIGSEFKPKNSKGQWETKYHTKLYDLTDRAARACPPGSRWVVFTNGDNLYHENAFREIAKARNADVVALDFYSRYNRPTGVLCDRFKAGEGVNPCKRNRMRWCHVDLGAVAYNWRRLVQENLRFSLLDEPGRFTSQDALMAEDVVNRGWKVKVLEGQCLFDQGPNPVSCAMRGGVWDERNSFSTHDFGGHCELTTSIAELLGDSNSEIVTVPLAQDGALAGFPEQGVTGPDLQNLTIACIRPAENYKFAMMRAFGEECMEDVDEALFAEYMKVRFPDKPGWKRTIRSLQNKVKDVLVGDASEEPQDIHDEL